MPLIIILFFVAACSQLLP